MTDDAVPAQQRMHHYDESLTRLILDYVQERLSLPETPLDHPGDKRTKDHRQPPTTRKPHHRRGGDGEQRGRGN